MKTYKCLPVVITVLFLLVVLGGRSLYISGKSWSRISKEVEMTGQDFVKPSRRVAAGNSAEYAGPGCKARSAYKLANEKVTPCSDSGFGQNSDKDAGGVRGKRPERDDNKSPVYYRPFQM